MNSADNLEVLPAAKIEGVPSLEALKMPSLEAFFQAENESLAAGIESDTAYLGQLERGLEEGFSVHSENFSQAFDLSGGTETIPETFNDQPSMEFFANLEPRSAMEQLRGADDATLGTVIEKIEGGDTAFVKSFFEGGATTSVALNEDVNETEVIPSESAALEEIEPLRMQQLRDILKPSFEESKESREIKESPEHAKDSFSTVAIKSEASVAAQPETSPLTAPSAKVETATGSSSESSSKLSPKPSSELPPQAGQERRVAQADAVPENIVEGKAEQASYEKYSSAFLYRKEPEQDISEMKIALIVRGNTLMLPEGIIDPHKSERQETERVVSFLTGVVPKIEEKIDQGKAEVSDSEGTIEIETNAFLAKSEEGDPVRTPQGRREVRWLTLKDLGELKGVVLDQYAETIIGKGVSTIQEKEKSEKRSGLF